MGDTAKLILSWACDFREGELTVEDIQDRFAGLEVSEMQVPGPVLKRILEAQQELDSIRYGMCEAGQRAEIERIFREFEGLLARKRTP